MLANSRRRGPGRTRSGVRRSGSAAPDRDRRRSDSVKVKVKGSATGSDAEERGAAPGEPGEICIGGPGVASRYLARPDLTAERFIDGPAGALPPGRWYRTGDRARLRDDGAIEFLGRTDRQVKLRGHRVELDEIEATILRLPQVRAAVVSVRGETTETEPRT